MKIVAPAGNLERFYSAVNAGADEIYMGIKGFGARRNQQLEIMFPNQFNETEKQNCSI